MCTKGSMPIFVRFQKTFHSGFRDAHETFQYLFRASRLATKEGSLLVFAGGEKRFDTNINFFLEEYGIMINTDAVVRTNYHKYFHPKECLISNGVLNRALSEAAGRSGTKFGLDIDSDVNNTQVFISHLSFPH